MTVLLATHPVFLEHITGPHHPERPSRLAAVAHGCAEASLAGRLTAIEPRGHPIQLELVHPTWYLDRLDLVATVGGGWIDADTSASAGSAQAAAMAAGAGLTAVDVLRRGEGSAAFCAVRPPGHQRTRTEAMGFCLVSNVSVVAAALADAGERVWILDIDAHHGNGTQDVFYDLARCRFRAALRGPRAGQNWAPCGAAWP